MIINATLRKVAAGTVLAAVLAIPALVPHIANSAQGPEPKRVYATTAELIVFETANCPYCRIFRRDVAPRYQRSPRAQQVPMRFINVHRTDMTKIHLNAPLTIVPTVVLMENGRERTRLTGYMGPEPFFHMIAQAMRK